MSSKAEAQLKPWCPFCGMDVGRPTEGARRKMREFPMGRCECGAVYVSEATGHNVGAAMVECLVDACGDDWDQAWELVPEDDYLTGLIAQAQTAAEDYCRTQFSDPAPEPVRLAVLLMVGFYYENRDIPDMTTYKAMRMAFDSLLYPYRDPEKMF